MRVAPYALAIVAAFQIATPGALVAQDSGYVPPADELALAKVIIDTMYPIDMREDMLLEVAANVGRQIAQTSASDPIFQEPGIKAIMDKFLADLPETLRPAFAKHMPLIFDATAVAYTRAFTLDELQDISRFAQTPSGQRYFSNLSGLLGDPAVAVANQGLIEEIGPLQQEQGTRVGQEVEAYLLANPAVLERLKKAGVGKR